MAAFEVLCGLVALFLVLYYFLQSSTFWEKKNIPGPKPFFIFGNFFPMVIGRTSLGDQMAKFYKQYKHEPVFGLYLRADNVLVINDPDLIKTVLIKDFSKFAYRGIHINEKTEPLSQHMFSLEPERWRPLRTRLSPIFTSGKLKGMFSLILDCSNTLEKYMETLVSERECIEVREVAARFTTDVIASCAFGVETNAMSKAQSRFREIGKEFFGPGLKQVLKHRFREGFPRFYTLLGYVLPKDDTTIFFTNAVMDMIEHRRKNNIVRPDFINTLMDLQDHPEKMNIELTTSFLVAQAFVFFMAGFETSSSAIATALYELAQHQDVQDKLRNEIREYYELTNGEWQYENIKKMAILDAVFKETLRKYPPVTVIMRKCTEDYTFENLKLTVPKDTRIFIP
ncbi:unnamed protein product, partial [Heterotrigona itama]